MVEAAARIALTLDVPTLLVLATWLAGLLGLLLFLAWISDRAVRALVWWSTAYIIGGSGVAMWSSGHELAPTGAQEVPGALLFLALGMIWTGARLFHGRSVRPFELVTGAALWLLLTPWPPFASGTTGRLILSSLGISGYTFLTAVEVWRERRGRPHTRCWATVVPMLHASVFLCPVVLPVIQPLLLPRSTGVPAVGPWFAALTLATLLYAVGTAFLILALVQDRNIRLHKDAASTDPLTGLSNRRAFLEYAQKLIGRCARNGQPVTLLMFDLDHFKSINDRFGHAIGDEALKLFARTASANMRIDDAIGRLGGEEFAAVVPGDAGVAAGIAERIRIAFETVGVRINEHELYATVSIGAAWTAENIVVDKVLHAADMALYRAKEGGRNRLVLAEQPVSGLAPGAAPASGRNRMRLPRRLEMATACRRLCDSCRQVSAAFVVMSGQCADAVFGRRRPAPIAAAKGRLEDR
jgi:diguanylate cyclase (GGDEF)-like protein